MNTVLSLMPAAFGAGYGASLLFRTRRQLEEAQENHRQRLEDRLARGSDAYLDELRSLQSYQPISSFRQRRLLGAALLLVAIAYVALLTLN